MKSIKLLLLMIPVFSFAVAHSPDSAYKRWMPGLSFESHLSNCQLIYSQEYQWVENMRNNNEIPTFGFAAGLSVRYSISAKWGIDAGLMYVNKGYGTRRESLIWSTPNSSYPDQSKTNFKYHFIEIPLKVNYNFTVGKFKFYATGGFSMNIFTNKTTTLITYYSNSDKSKTKDQNNYSYRQFTGAGMLGLGVNIPILKSLLLNIEPMYRHNFISIVADKNAREYLYSVSLNTRLFIHLQSKK